MLVMLEKAHFAFERTKMVDMFNNNKITDKLIISIANTIFDIKCAT